MGCLLGCGPEPEPEPEPEQNNEQRKAETEGGTGKRRGSCQIRPGPWSHLSFADAYITCICVLTLHLHEHVSLTQLSSPKTAGRLIT